MIEANRKKKCRDAVERIQTEAQTGTGIYPWEASGKPPDIETKVLDSLKDCELEDLEKPFNLSTRRKK